MKLCVPRITTFRGAGLGNELFPWAKAYLAGRELGARVLDPAWGINRRGYAGYFGTNPCDWLLARAIRTLPAHTLTQEEYRSIGIPDYAAAVREFAARRGLLEKPHFILQTEGIWGGNGILRSASDFLLSRLYATRYTADNLHAFRRQTDPDRLLVALHVRGGDFREPLESETEYQNVHNTRIPLSWYIDVCEALAARLGGKIQFAVFSDDPASALEPLLSRIRPAPLTSFGLRHRDISDLLILRSADVLIGSLSTYSMLAASLSAAPYIWYAPHANRTECGNFECFDLWGHEPRNAVTLGFRKKALALAAEGKDFPRGFPMGPRPAVDDRLAEALTLAWRMKQTATDLMFYGTAPFPGKGQRRDA